MDCPLIDPSRIANAPTDFQTAKPPTHFAMKLLAAVGDRLWGAPPPLTDKSFNPAVENKLTTTTANPNSLGWVSSKINCYSKKVLQASAQDGTIRIQSFYKLKNNITFTLNCPTANFSFSSQLEGQYPFWMDAFWITTIGGVLKVPVNGTDGPVLYPISNPNVEPYLIPSYCEGTKGLTLDYSTGLTGFSLYDFTLNPPKLLFQQTGFEAIFRKMGNQKLLCFYEGQGSESQDSLQLWNIESQKMEWALDNQDDWFKRDGGTYFGFRSTMPKPDTVIADVGRDVYVIDTSKPSIQRIRIDGPEDSGISPLIFLDQDRFICRYFSSNIVHLYSVESGKINTFEIGQNLDADTDGFPLIVNNEELVALDVVDNKKLHLWNLNTNNTDQRFETADHPLNELYLSGKKDRVIGLHLKNDKNPQDCSALYVWDYQSGKILFKYEDAGILAFNSLSDNILSLDHTNNTIITENKRKERKSKEVMVKDQPLDIHITLWDLGGTCQKAADIKETFAPANGGFKLVYTFTNVGPSEYEMNAWWNPSEENTLVKKSYRLS